MIATEVATPSEASTRYNVKKCIPDCFSRRGLAFLLKCCRLLSNVYRMFCELERHGVPYVNLVYGKKSFYMCDNWRYAYLPEL